MSPPIREFARRLRRSVFGAGSYQRTAWPVPPLQEGVEPSFLFILTPPFSGSTAVAQILNTAHGTAFLHKKAEGQWLIPGMCTKDRWSPEKVIDWNSVRAVWMSQIQMVRSLAGRVDLIIEKSPPNMVRVEPLLRTFPDHFVVAMNRNPFARVASGLYRTCDAGALTPEGRRAALIQLARLSLDHCRWIRKSIEALGAPYVSYERFCARPDDLTEILAKRFPLLDKVNASGEILVKDYAPAPLENHNRRQIERLTPWDVSAISDVLREEPDVNAFFGYDPTGAEEMEIAAEVNSGTTIR